MSQIFFEPVQLERVIKFSDVIIVVEKQKPLLTYEKIKIKAPFGKKCPDYNKAIYNFKVINELYNNDKSILNKTIKVISATYEEDLEQHKMYYIDGIMESPIYFSYDSKLDINTENKFIIFLNKVKDKDEYRYSYSFANESTNNQEKIENLILNIKTRYYEFYDNQENILIMKYMDKKENRIYADKNLTKIFNSNINNHFLFYIIIPNYSLISKMFLIINNRETELDKISFLYRSPTSPKAAYFITQKNNKYKLIGKDQQNNVIVEINFEKEKYNINNLPLNLMDSDNKYFFDLNKIPGKYWLEGKNEN